MNICVTILWKPLEIRGFLCFLWILTLTCIAGFLWKNKISGGCFTEENQRNHKIFFCAFRLFYGK